MSTSQSCRELKPDHIQEVPSTQPQIYGRLKSVILSLSPFISILGALQGVYLV